MTLKTYLPEGVDTVPTTPAEALAVARTVIAEEGRWAKETWYEHHNRELPEYQDNPYCNGWETCAAGALLLVTVGMTSEPPEYACSVDCRACNDAWRIPDSMPSEVAAAGGAGTPAERLYYDALRYLGDAVQERTGDYDRWNIVPRFNDNPLTTRDDVLEMFRDAEARALAAEPEKVPA